MMMANWTFASTAIQKPPLAGYPPGPPASREGSVVLASLEASGKMMMDISTALNQSPTPAARFALANLVACMGRTHKCAPNQANDIPGHSGSQLGCVTD